MKTKFTHSEDVPQGCIVVGSYGIVEVKEYIYVGHVVNICRDMDTKMSGKLDQSRRHLPR